MKTIIEQEMKTRIRKHCQECCGGVQLDCKVLNCYLYKYQPFKGGKWKKKSSIVVSAKKKQLTPAI